MHGSLLVGGIDVQLGTHGVEGHGGQVGEVRPQPVVLAGAG